MDTTLTCATASWPDVLGDRFVYHAAPLHYVPRILADGRLVAKLVGAGQGIAPRSSAVRRDRMLGLAKYVHFGFEFWSPLLCNKLRKGYPHAVFAFPAQAVASLPGVALLPYNTKAWKSREAARPANGTPEMLALWQAHEHYRRLPSLELLAPYAVDLGLAAELVFCDDEDRDAVVDLVDALGIRSPTTRLAGVAAGGHGLGIGFCPRDSYRKGIEGRIAAHAYIECCRREGTVLPPPNVPFD